MTLEKAYKILPSESVTASLHREMNKVHTTFKSLRPITPDLIEPLHQLLRAQVLVKEKRDGSTTSRLAIEGRKQYPDSYNSTHAGTFDTEKLLCLASACIADAAHRNVPLEIFGFDLPAAFLQAPLTRSDTNGFQLLTRLPSNMPGLLAGQLNEITGPQYGIKQSNNLFNHHLRTQLATIDYHPSILGPHIYHKQCPLNPQNYILVNMHVDDGAGFSTSPTLTIELKAFLSKHFGSHSAFPLTWHPELTEYCAISFTRTPDASLKADMGKYIRQLLTKEGMDLIPGSLSPALPGFFDPPTDLTPFDPVQYQSTQGGLLFANPIRHDVKTYVNHLSRSNIHPTQSDREKQIHVLRYLKEHPDEGPTFSANPVNYPNGPQLSASADNSHASLPNAQSLSGILYFIGNNNAAFSSFASAEPGIALSPQQAEYETLSRAAKQCVYWQQFLNGLGFQQSLPTIIHEDNLPAINLVTAPEVTRNSRHILIKHHYIRWLYQQGIVRPVHQGTNDLSADFLTKVHPPRKFHFFKDVVFNSQPYIRQFLARRHLHPHE